VFIITGTDITHRHDPIKKKVTQNRISQFVYVLRNAEWRISRSSGIVVKKEKTINAREILISQPFWAEIK
jgi:hypothetical protein